MSHCTGHEHFTHPSIWTIGFGCRISEYIVICNASFLVLRYYVISWMSSDFNTVLCPDIFQSVKRACMETTAHQFVRVSLPTPTHVYLLMVHARVNQAGQATTVRQTSMNVTSVQLTVQETHNVSTTTATLSVNVSMDILWLVQATVKVSSKRYFVKAT